MSPLLLSELINEILVKSTILTSDKSFIEELTPRQVHIVQVIDQHVYKHGELASKLEVEPSTLTRTLDPLVKKGIVERELNPNNRREVLIRLSNKGTLYLKQIDDKIQYECQKVIDNIETDKLPMVEAAVKMLLDSYKKST